MTATESPATETESPCSQGYLSDNFGAFTSALAEVDKVLEDARPIDRKTDELIRFALSIKARSEPCVRKHWAGCQDAGATDDEISYVFALTMREAAGADDCWTHGIIADMPSGGGSCGCG